MKSEYLLVLGVTVFFPFILSFDKNLALHMKVQHLIKAILTTCVVFWVWDIVATARGHWSFNPQYVLGIAWLGLPLEEWLFFVVVSFVSIFSWESAKYFFRNR